MNIYVGNLSYGVTEQEVSDEFSKFGTVDSVKLITDRDSGQPKGFGFVEMSNNEEAKKAIADLNGKQIKDREIKVNEARPKESRR